MGTRTTRLGKRRDQVTILLMNHTRYITAGRSTLYLANTSVRHFDMPLVSLRGRGVGQTDFPHPLELVPIPVFIPHTKGGTDGLVLNLTIIPYHFIPGIIFRFVLRIDRVSHSKLGGQPDFTHMGIGTICALPLRVTPAIPRIEQIGDILVHFIVDQLELSGLGIILEIRFGHTADTAPASYGRREFDTDSNGFINTGQTGFMLDPVRFHILDPIRI